MKSFFKKYLWLFEFIGAAITIAMGFVIGFNPEVLYLIVGLIFTIFGLFRLVPLLKTTDDKLVSAIYLLELLLNVGAGVALIVMYIQGKTENSGNAKLIGYLIASVLYLRGLIFFFATSLRKESTDFTKFIGHIGLFTVGSMIFGAGGFETKTLGWIIFFLALLTGVVLAFNGFSNYNKYRHETKAIEKTKEMFSDEIELPSKNENKEVPIEEEVERDQVTLQ